MFARKFWLLLCTQDTEAPVPKDWLDHFFMRDFTGYSAFDETLVVGDGRLEAGFNVQPEQIRVQLEKWLRGRKMISPDTSLKISADS